MTSALVNQKKKIFFHTRFFDFRGFWCLRLLRCLWPLLVLPLWISTATAQQSKPLPRSETRKNLLPKETKMPFRPSNARIPQKTGVDVRSRPPQSLLAKTTPKPMASSDRAAKSVNLFALSLYKALWSRKTKKTQKAENLVFSPFSIHLALTMAFAGSRKKTKAAISKTLCLRSEEHIHEDYQTLSARLHKNSSETASSFVSSQRIWVQKGLGWEKDFLSTLQTHYHAKPTEQDFQTAPEVARKEINQAIAKETKQKIQQILPPQSIRPLTRLILTNTVFFDGKWQKGFDKNKTVSEAFHLDAKKQINVRMMYDTREVALAENNDAKMAILPYMGDFRLPNGSLQASFELWIVLPQKRFALHQLRNFLSFRELRMLRDQAEAKKLVLGLPRFTATSAFSLKKSLSKMGMAVAFSKKADFGRMLRRPQGIRLDQVYHQAFLRVDEVGTQASAVTAVIGGAKGVSFLPRFLVDEPFLVFLHNNQTQTLLFMAEIQHPQL